MAQRPQWTAWMQLVLPLRHGVMMIARDRFGTDRLDALLIHLARITARRWDRFRAALDEAPDPWLWIRTAEEEWVRWRAWALKWRDHYRITDAQWTGRYEQCRAHLQTEPRDPIALAEEWMLSRLAGQR